MLWMIIEAIKSLPEPAPGTIVPGTYGTSTQIASFSARAHRLFLSKQRQHWTRASSWNNSYGMTDTVLQMCHVCFCEGFSDHT